MNPSYSYGPTTPEELEAEFIGFKFKGPGLYLTDTDTTIVIPEDRGENVWNEKQPEGTRYYFHVWNAPFRETILSKLASMPTKSFPIGWK